MLNPFRRIVDYCQPGFGLDESDSFGYELFVVVTVAIHLASAFLGLKLTLEYGAGFSAVVVLAVLGGVLIGLRMVLRVQKLWERMQPIVYALVRLAVLVLAGALVGITQRRFVHVANQHSQLAWVTAILLDIGLVALGWLLPHAPRWHLVYVLGVGVTTSVVSIMVTRRFDPFTILRDGDVAVLGVLLWIVARKVMNSFPVGFRPLIDLSCAQAVFILLSGLSMM